MAASRILGAVPAALLTTLLLAACSRSSVDSTAPGDRPADREGSPAMSSEAIETLAVQDVAVPLEGERATLRVKMPEALPRVAGGEAGERLGLYLEGVEPGSSGTSYEVYANLPPNAEPRPSGPHYLGTLAIFGPKDEAGAKMGYDITPLMKNGGEGDLTLTFIRRGLEPPKGQTGPATVPDKAPPLKIKRVRIVRE